MRAMKIEEESSFPEKLMQSSMLKLELSFTLAAI